jgi:serine/threonine protein kinase
MAKHEQEKFGKCRVSKVIGRGAVATVYEGWHEGLQMEVAVKVLRKAVSEKHPDFADRFMREAKTAARLTHPNIVHVIDCGSENGHLYMVMDLVDGKDTLQMSREQPTGMAWREVCNIALQVADGLSYAASQGVIHRDVKPANIIMDKAGRAHITDLGLAKLSIRGTAELTGELHTVGTPNYMSPEQIRNPSDTDLRADVYSLGATVYRLLCGRPPFRARSPMDVVAMHLTAMPVPPSKIRAEVPLGLSDIVRKMLAKAPGDRYQDYEELSADIHNVMAGNEVTATEFHDVPLLESDAELEEVLSELNFLAELEIEDPEASSVDFAVVPEGVLGSPPEAVQLFEEDEASDDINEADLEARTTADVQLPEDLDELAQDLQPVTPPVLSSLWMRRKLRALFRARDHKVHWGWFAASMVLLILVIILVLRLAACGAG